MTSANYDHQDDHRDVAPEGPSTDARLVAELIAKNQQLKQQLITNASAATSFRRREHQMRQVINALPALVAYIDTHHRYRFNNYAYERWYDLPYQQIRGRQVNDIVSLPIYRKMLPYLEQALAGESVDYEIEMVQSSGQKVWTSVTYIPDVQDGRVRGLFSLMNDISGHKAAEKIKDEFVSIVSHELRTPLTSVHGSLKLLATGELGQLDNQGQELLSIALQNTERLSRLLNDVLDLERMESGHLQLSLGICDAFDLINRATQAMQSMANAHGVKLAIAPTKNPHDKRSHSKRSHSKRPHEQQAHALGDRPLLVWADSDTILQTLTNLLSNAIKFSPQGETVKIKARRANPKTGRYIEFVVKDAGRGIPTDKLDTIFERFHQVDSSDARERGGTGLGLAICREIVQQHQGRIWVKSVHGKGSTFYFTLPMPPEADTANDAE